MESAFDCDGIDSSATRRTTLPSTCRFGTRCGPQPTRARRRLTSRMDSPVVFGHLSGASRARAEHLIQLKEEVEAQKARYPGRVTFARIPRERNGAADELAKDGARASKERSALRRRYVPHQVKERFAVVASGLHHGRRA